MLFRQDKKLERQKNPAAFPNSQHYGGLDAREHLPPLLKPNSLMIWDTYQLWEQHAVEFLAREEYSAEEALLILCITAEKLRGWSRKRKAMAREYLWDSAVVEL